MTIVFTRHASERFQQRGFKKELQDLILKFGEWVYVGSGCYRVAIDRSSALALISSRTVDQGMKTSLRANFDKVTRKAILVGDQQNVVTVFNQTRRRWEK